MKTQTIYGFRMTLEAYVWVICIAAMGAGVNAVMVLLMAGRGDWWAALVPLAGVMFGVWAGPVVGARVIAQKLREREG